MDNYLITVVFLSFFTKTVFTEADLQQQNADQDQLNPLNDFEHADTSAKDQDKRTIFGSGTYNHAWAKHVGYHPSGFRYVLGYTPVGLKYAPVLRPISIKQHGYYYGRPKVQWHLKRPLVHAKPPRPVYGAPWKPTTAILRPTLPINPPHVHVDVAKPVHVDHVHGHVNHVHGHVDHIHSHGNHIHSVQHVDHFHKVPVHVDHVHPAPQPVHVHPVPLQPVHQTFVPAAAPAQFIHSHLFEVTKPNLGVLPLGSVFPSPILRNPPPPPAAVQYPLRPALLPQPVAPAPVPLPHPQPAVIPYPHQPTVISQPPAVPVAPPPAIPQQVGPQPVYPPGTVVEFHGTTGFINLAQGHAPGLPQTPVNAVQPHHYYLQYPHVHQNIPVQAHEQHDVQTPLVPDNHPYFIRQHEGYPQFQQQLPQDASPHFQPVGQVNPHNVLQQQLPFNQQSHFQHVDQANPHNVFQQQLPVNQQSHFQQVDQGNPHNVFQQELPNNQLSEFHSDQNNQHFFQQQIPQDSQAHFQPADQVSSQHFFQHPGEGQQGQFQSVDQNDGGYIYQQPDIASAQQTIQIQPGQTDLQFPVHLPHHPGFVQNSRQFQTNSPQEHFSENVFRPSIQLEPPYKK